MMNENKKRYSLQRNYCVSLLRKTQKVYYGNLDIKKVRDNKIFWKTVKPFLSDEIVPKQQIRLIENDKIISKDSDVAQSLNSFFTSIVTNLKISECTNNNSYSETTTDRTIKVILNYSNYPSILTIGEVCKSFFIFKSM